MNRNPVTPEGYQAMVEELQQLKSVERPKIVRDIEEARAHGDISENSEYEDAKERQSLCEGRINELENRVATAEIIDVTKLNVSDRIVFGCTVEVEEVSTEESSRYKIVGELEADVNDGKISFKSPLGRALIGKEEGDEVTVHTPGGKRLFEVTEVSYE